MDHTPIEELLADAAWTRALAGALVGDAAAADDVVQETWRAALERPPAAGVPVRAWLTTVVRNFARKSWRDETRRRGREEAAARADESPLPRPDELTERLDTQRALARHVGALDEPFRSTVILRYWEGLSSAEIARRQGTPAGTVRWRLKKGLDELRDRLDREHRGDRAAWLALLLPIAEPRPASAPTTGGSACGAALAGLGGALAVKKAAIAVAAVVVLVLSLHLAGVFDSATPAPPAPPGETPPDLVAAGGPAAETDPGETADPAPGAGGATADVGSARIAARIVGADGRPVEGARVEPGPLSEPAHTGADGRFELTLEIRGDTSTARLAIVAAGHARREVEAGLRRGGTTRLGDVALAPGGVVTGRVIGPDGRAAGEAKLKLTEPFGGLDHVPESRAEGPLSLHRATADAEGRFRIEGVPVGYWHVWAGAEGTVWSATAPVEVRADREPEAVEITLSPQTAPHRYTGVVLGPDGAPVPNVRVGYLFRNAAGKEIASGLFSAEDGRFECDDRPETTAEFRARDPEGLLGEARVVGARPGGGEIELRLAPMRRMVFRVAAEGGGALHAFTVELREAGKGRQVDSARGKDGVAALVATGVTFTIRVAADGHETRTLGPFGPEDAPALSRVELRPLPGIRGVVLSGGKPLAGARVRVHAVADPRWHSERNGFTVTREWPRAEAVTGPDGSFRLTPARAERVTVRVDADGFAPAETAPFPYRPERGRTGLEIACTAGGAIEGAVTASDGGDPTGAIVGISRGDGYGRTARVGADGRFRFERLTPGRWLVVLRKEEILPGASSGFGGGRRKPIPFNCEVVEGETAVHDLVIDRAVAVLTGSFLLDGACPRGFTAGIYAPGGGLVPRVEVPVAEDGGFTLRSGEGPSRLIVRGPGPRLESILVVADLDLAGETAWSCSLRTGTLTVSGDAAEQEEVMLFHRLESEGGAVVLTPLPAGATPVPAGKGEVVRFERSLWSKPRAWPALAAVEVPPGGEAGVRLR